VPAPLAGPSNEDQILSQNGYFISLIHGEDILSASPAAFPQVIYHHEFDKKN
jgi:hypothetical protein